MSCQDPRDSTGYDTEIRSNLFTGTSETRAQASTSNATSLVLINRLVSQHRASSGEHTSVVPSSGGINQRILSY
jgi:hypothetical protein